MVGIFSPESLHTLSSVLRLVLRDGLPTTVTLAILGFILALLVGGIVGLIRFLRVPVISFIFRVYVDSMRGLPFLMIVFVLYYVLPFFGLRFDAFNTAVLALTMHTGAYLSEIVRGSLQAIPYGQHEAGKALALSTRKRLQHVIIPQAVQISLPPMAGQSVLHIKDTSVVSIIGLTEMTRVARVQMQSNMNPLLTFAVLTVMYFLICYPVLRLSAKLERKLAAKRA